MHVKFASGFSVSIQASGTHYCTPRTNAGPWTHVELGYPNCYEETIMPWAEDPENPTNTVYGWVPAGVVSAMCVRHGGIVEGSIPHLDIDMAQSITLAETLNLFGDKYE